MRISDMHVWASFQLASLRASPALCLQILTARRLPEHTYLRYACFGSPMHPDRTVSGRSTSPTSPFLRAANAPPGPPRPMSRFKWDMGLRGVPVSRLLLHPGRPDNVFGTLGRTWEPPPYPCPFSNGTGVWGGVPCPDYCCTGTCYRGCLLVCRDRLASVGASLVASQTCLERVTQHRLVDEAVSATSAVSRYASF